MIEYDRIFDLGNFPQINSFDFVILLKHERVGECVQLHRDSISSCRRLSPAEAPQARRRGHAGCPWWPVPAGSGAEQGTMKQPQDQPRQEASTTPEGWVTGRGVVKAPRPRLPGGSRVESICQELRPHHEELSDRSGCCGWASEGCVGGRAGAPTGSTP